jgi:hypothetical protein
VLKGLLVANVLPAPAGTAAPNQTYIVSEVLLFTVPEGFVLKYEVQGNCPVEIPQLGGAIGVRVGVAVNVVVEVGVEVGVPVGVAVNVVVVVGVGDGGIAHTASSKQLPKDSEIEQINIVPRPP